MPKRSSRSKSVPSINLRALEEEVLAEGREWMQQRLGEKLREKCESFSPDGGEAAPECPAPEVDGENPVR
jgi:hypothetical protein